MLILNNREMLLRGLGGCPGQVAPTVQIELKPIILNTKLAEISSKKSINYDPDPMNISLRE